MKDKIITMEFVNKLASYLASKPYIEVAQLLQELSNLQDVEEKEVVKPE